VTILLRVESSAIIGLLVRKGVITSQEWMKRWKTKRPALKGLRAAFPGAKATTTVCPGRRVQAG